MNLAAPITILVVEDDEPIRQILSDILEINGFSVLQASDGEAGLKAAAQARPNLILTDIGMPGLDGFEMIKRLRADPVLRHTRVIVISALAERNQIRRGMEVGADDYIPKPFTEDEVIKAIQAQLAKQGASL